jgi:hypothetical protein
MTFCKCPELFCECTFKTKQPEESFWSTHSLKEAIINSVEDEPERPTVATRCWECDQKNQIRDKERQEYRDLADKYSDLFKKYLELTEKLK